MHESVSTTTRLDDLLAVQVGGIRFEHRAQSMVQVGGDDVGSLGNSSGDSFSGRILWRSVLGLIIPSPITPRSMRSGKRTVSCSSVLSCRVFRLRSKFCRFAWSSNETQRNSVGASSGAVNAVAKSQPVVEFWFPVGLDPDLETSVAGVVSAQIVI